VTECFRGHGVQGPAQQGQDQRRYPEACPAASQEAQLSNQLDRAQPGERPHSYDRVGRAGLDVLILRGGGNMNEQQNTVLVRKLYDAFARGDIQTILDNLTRDAEWIQDGPTVIPYAGKKTGPTQVRQFCDALVGTQDKMKVTIDHFIALVQIHPFVLQIFSEQFDAGRILSRYDPVQIQACAFPGAVGLIALGSRETAGEQARVGLDLGVQRDLRTRTGHGLRFEDPIGIARNRMHKLEIVMIGQTDGLCNEDSWLVFPDLKRRLPDGSQSQLEARKNGITGQGFRRR